MHLDGSNKSLNRLALVTSHLKTSDFLTLWTGTLAPFTETPAPFGPILSENGMRGSRALSVRLRFLGLCKVLGSLHHANHSSTTSCIHRHTQFHIYFSHIPFHVDTYVPFLEDDLGKRILLLPL